MDLLRHKLHPSDAENVGFRASQDEFCVPDNEQLRSSIDSAQALARRITLNDFFDIPRTVSSIFTGRESKLKELKYMLDVATPQERSHTQKRFVIYGLGGSGKTEFCCKFAQDNREQWVPFLKFPCQTNAESLF